MQEWAGRWGGLAMESSSLRNESTGRSALKRVLGMSIVLFVAASAAAAANAATDGSADLTELSLEELMNIEVTSVSKKAQSKTGAAAAITVITAEDIRRGGFTLIPEALRIVPGLAVARVDANRWSISVRGNAGLFSNKLLVLIDGRSVYTPAFGGTYWDAQDYPIEDVERIEVIRGPGGTVWGANAVNGVINIITKNSEDTQGGLISGYGGNREAGVTARFGGAVGEDTHYRVYGRGFEVSDSDISKNRDGHDEWRHGRLGFRADSKPTEVDTVRVSGDFYSQKNEQGALNPTFVPLFLDVHYTQRGGNVLVHWDRKLSEDSNFKAKAYYTGDYREFMLEEERHTADLEVQHDFTLQENLSVTWGANYRYSTTHISRDPKGIPIAFDPNDENVHLASGFGQVQYDLLDDKLSLIAGTKLTYYSWSGFEYQPSGRFVARPADGHVIWGAVSRAVRTPSEADRDVDLTLPSPVPPSIRLQGDRGTRSEELLAFELGYRFFALEKINAEISLFWNEYDSRSSFEQRLVPPPTTLTVKFANRSESTNRGVELEVNIRPLSWWRLKLGYSYLNIDEDVKSTSIPLTSEKKDNPKHKGSLQSFMELPLGFEFDTSVYLMDGLPGIVPTGQPDNVEYYVRLDLRLGYRPTDWAEISLVGTNLTDRRHYEGDDFTQGESTQVPRAGYAKVTLTF
jgi:iron complex outermembrane receptor protein